MSSYPSDDQEAARALVAEGLCPICYVGPFAVVALHVARKHGVDRFQLRDMLGVYKTTSICDEGHSAARSRLSRQQWTAERATKMEVARPRGRGTRELSEAGKERNRRQAEAHREQTAEVLKQNSERIHQAALVRYRAWQEQWEAGLSLAEIARRFEVSRSATIKDGLRAVGVDIGREGLLRRRRRGAAAA